MRSRRVFRSCLVLISVLVPARAAALPPGVEHVQLELGVNYGLYLGGAEQDIPTPYGLGVHVRAGYTLPIRLYLGAESNHFFGESQAFPEYGDVSGSLSVWQIGAEVGYDLSFASCCVLRPKLDVGAATVTITGEVEGVRDQVAETGLALGAGVQALTYWNDFFAAGEARWTRLHIGTEALDATPGLELADNEVLDGILFAVGLGYQF